MQRTGSAIRVRCQLTRDLKFATFVNAGHQFSDCFDSRPMALDNENKLGGLLTPLLSS